MKIGKTQLDELIRSEINEVFGLSKKEKLIDDIVYFYPLHFGEEQNEKELKGLSLPALQSIWGDIQARARAEGDKPQGGMYGDPEALKKLSAVSRNDMRAVGVMAVGEAHEKDDLFWSYEVAYEIADNLSKIFSREIPGRLEEVGPSLPLGGTRTQSDKGPVSSRRRKAAAQERPKVVLNADEVFGEKATRAANTTEPIPGVPNPSPKIDPQWREKLLKRVIEALNTKVGEVVEFVMGRTEPPEEQPEAPEEEEIELVAPVDEPEAEEPAAAPTPSAEEPLQLTPDMRTTMGAETEAGKEAEDFIKKQFVKKVPLAAIRDFVQGSNIDGPTGREIVKLMKDRGYTLSESQLREMLGRLLLKEGENKKTLNRWKELSGIK